jgi:ubiquinone/menaquinone biosynthesis C-methylase UbiE
MRYDERAFDVFMYPLERVALAKRRRRLLPQASGVVLEIGAGTGANLPFYNWPHVSALHLLDLSITEAVRSFSPPNGTEVVRTEGRAESLPFDDATFDAVVFTLVFCSVDEPDRGLAEVRRVLKPGGRLFFIEHVRPSRRPRMAGIVDAVNPLWHSLSGECNINRDTVRLIRNAGFTLETLSRGGAGLLASGTARA